MTLSLLPPPEAPAIKLRPYQVEAVSAVYDHLRRRDDHPCVVIPTAGGKTPVMASICRDAVGEWGGRVLILAHVKELLEQAVEKLHVMAPDLWNRIGVYSAGLKSRDTDHPIIVAGIQSVYKRAAELDAFDLICIDEAHMLPPDGEGMYRTFLTDARVVNPNIRLIGLTATPYRMSTGMICGPEDERLLNHVCYEVGVRELIVQGYLCPLKTKAGRRKADTSNLHIRGGEFIAGEVEALMDDDSLVRSACSEIADHTRDRSAVLIFASGVKHARHVQRVLAEMGFECGFVCGETLPFERAETLQRFKAGRLKFLVNVNVLTTGFDAPNIDCVAMLRPTNSPGLFYQMCLDMDTEVLTETGWAKCDGVRRGDRIAAFDMETGRIEWCKALDKVHRGLAPGEGMYGVQSPHLDIRVTDRHEMVYRGRSYSCRHWRKREAHDLAALRDSYYIPVAGENDGPGLPLSDDEIRFIGWQLTDGHTNPHNQAIVIAQSSRSPHNGDIKSMLEGCGFGYRVYRRERKGRFAQYADNLTYVIPFGNPRGGNKGKRGWKHLARFFLSPLRVSLRDISHRQLGILLEAMNLGDGCKRKNLSWTSRTVTLCLGEHKHFADELQALLIQRGYRCNIRMQRQRTNWHVSDPKPQYILHIRRQTRASIGGSVQRPSRLVKRRSQFKPVPFDPSEEVWCLKTEYGTLVTRRNGKVAILGNCGRGFRLHPDKTDCLVLDYGGNILRHGPVDDLKIKEPGRSAGEAPAKECPECQAVIHAAYAICPECGYEFPPPERQQHDRQASTAGILSGEVTETEYEVSDVYYSIHVKRGAPEDHPRTMRVDYTCGFNDYHSEWVCPEHTGYARSKFEAWWRARSNEPAPDTVEEAVDICDAGGIAPTSAITVRSVAGEKFDRIVDYRLGAIPPRLDGRDEQIDGDLPESVWPEDEIPF